MVTLSNKMVLLLYKNMVASITKGNTNQFTFMNEWGYSYEENGLLLWIIGAAWSNRVIVWLNKVNIVDNWGYYSILKEKLTIEVWTLGDNF